MSEEVNRTPEAPASGSTKKPRTPHKKTGVGLYLVILFAAAFLMLLLAYFMQVRSSEETLGSLKESLTSIESLDDLIKQNQDLHDEVDELEGALEAAEKNSSELEKSYQSALADAETAQTALLSWSVFWEAEELYRAEDYEACAELVRSWGVSTFYTTPDAAAGRAAEIFDHLVSLELITADDLVWQMFR